MARVPPIEVEVTVTVDDDNALLDYAMSMRRRVELLADALTTVLAELEDEDAWIDTQDVLVYCSTDPTDEDAEEWIFHQWGMLRRTAAQLVADRPRDPRR